MDKVGCLQDRGLVQAFERCTVPGHDVNMVIFDAGERTFVTNLAGAAGVRHHEIQTSSHDGSPDEAVTRPGYLIGRSAATVK
jgi:hypothetical protein